MTCRDCIHFTLCSYIAYEKARYFGKDKKIYINIANNSTCRFFKSTAGVVEVVRCKDCFYFKCFGECNRTGIEANLNDFCSYGERKTDDV